MNDTSDPVSFECSCPARESGDGVILLFYRYFAAPPKLPSHHNNNAEEHRDFQRNLCDRLNLKGKIRIANEGFNVTVGGTKAEIDEYMRECSQHWSFDGLELDTDAERDAFFKPTPGGCACAFQMLNIRITSEITPLGVTNYSPKNWDVVKNLTPAEFHDKCWQDEKKVLLDVRNHYESRIGYFVNPISGEKAITPEVRRFSQFPLFVKTHLAELEELREETQSVLTYCTGGIRCEKSVRWMAEKLQPRDGKTIYTLQGGVAAYLTWIDGEIAAGRKSPADSLFQGKNYVFDARGSTGLAHGGGGAPLSKCHGCGTPSDRLSKCRSKACHLVLTICKHCEDTVYPRCCTNCEDLDKTLSSTDRRPICECELKREKRLRTVKHL
jgi:predicted sulfurtransferase